MHELWLLGFKFSLRLKLYCFNMILTVFNSLIVTQNSNYGVWVLSDLAQDQRCIALNTILRYWSIKLQSWQKHKCNRIARCELWNISLQTLFLLCLRFAWWTLPLETDKVLCTGFNEVKRVAAEHGTHHSKSSSVHGQESDIWEIYWSLALTHRTFAFSFWKILFIPMMHTLPCDE